jgi:hypothetical protein
VAQWQIPAQTPGKLAVALMSTVGVALPYPILSPPFIDGPVNGFTHRPGTVVTLVSPAAGQFKTDGSGDRYCGSERPPSTCRLPGADTG